MMQIRFSFLAVAAVMIAMGYALPFCLLFVSVTLHELTHVFVARKFGGRVGRIAVTALGEAAAIRGMEAMSAGRRSLVYLAGPGVNAFICLCAYVVVSLYPAAAWIHVPQQIGLYNAVLCLFNLLPVFPLDGGRLAQLWIGRYAGIPRANRFIIKLSRVLCLLLIAAGLVQVILYPYNISLVCAGFYISRVNKRTGLPLAGEFFQTMLKKSAWMEGRGVLPVKILAACAHYPLTRVMDRMGWDFITCIMVDGEKHNMLTEPELLRYVEQYGLTGTVGEALARII